MCVDPSPLSFDLPPWTRRGALALYCLLLALPATSILRDLPIYGDDNSSHLAAIHHLLALLRGRETDLFCPTFNLGFPMYLYYQPLPHLAAALVHLLSFGALAPQLAFNLTIVALWCCYPLTVYLGARRLGLGDTAALLGAIAAPLVNSSLPFGFTLHSVMGLGLYTQLYAMVLFPLCLGWTWHALHRADDRGWRAALPASGLHLLVWLSHAFYGVAAASAAVVMVLVAPRRWLRSLPRLGLVGLLTVASLLFWLIPLAQTAAHAGGWPWEGVDRWDGYGAWRVTRELLAGRLFDEHSVPALSLALGGGLATAAWSWRARPVLRALLVSFALFLFFLIGRRTFGPLVEIQPANRGLQLFRYIGPVHAVGVLLAAVGLAQLARLVGRYHPGPATALAVVAALLVPSVTGLTLTSRAYFHTIRSYAVTDRDLVAVARAIGDARRQGAPPGRIYTHTKAGHGTHLVAAALAPFTDQPLGQSYGVSMHDSLGFFYLEHLEPLSSTLRALYNFRYALTRPDTPLAQQQREEGNTPLLRRGTLELWRLRGDHRYFELVDLSLALVGAPREIRPAAVRWLGSSLVASRQFGLVVPHVDAVPAELAGHVLRGTGDAAEVRQGARWEPLGTRLVAARARPPSAAGSVLEEQTALNRYRARVEVHRAATLALKVMHHPFWRVTVDGAPAPLLMVTPSFLAVHLEPGLHVVEFRFHNPLAQKLLLGAALLLWIVLPLSGLRRSRRASSASPAASSA
jgi:hypothetical protein